MLDACCNVLVVGLNNGWDGMWWGAGGSGRCTAFMRWICGWCTDDSCCMCTCAPGASRGSSSMPRMNATNAPDCAVRGSGSGRWILWIWVARDEDEDGRRLCWMDGTAGMFGSLGPAVPSDDGDVSYWHPTGSPTESSGWTGEGDGTPRELQPASTSLSSVEAADDDEGTVEDSGGCGNSSMAVAYSSATSEW